MILKDEILGRHVRNQPHKVAIVFGDTRLTFKELNDRVNRLTNALVKLGVKKGDRVGILADNCHQYVEIACAALKGGMVMVPVNPLLPEKHQVYLINNVEPTTIIFSENYAHRLDTIKAELIGVQNFIVIGNGGKAAKSYEALIAASTAKEPEVTIRDDDLCTIVLTGGTTGLSKQVMFTYGRIKAVMFKMLYIYNMRDDDVFLLALPLYWGYATHSQIFSHLYMGCTSVMLKEFDPSLVLEVIEREKVSDYFVASSLIPLLAGSPDVSKYNHSSLRRIIAGGAPLAPEVWKRAIEIFGHVFGIIYGAVELSVISFLSPEELVFDGPPQDAKGRSCGRRMLFVDMKIVDDAGSEMPQGRVGEIIARGADLMAGYWRSTKATEDAIRDGYFHTGDLGLVDEDGYVHIVGRKVEVITSQGNIIPPAEVEDVIYHHPSVQEVAVVGIPDERLGEAVKAVIVLKQGARADVQEIVELCRSYLPTHAVPASIEFVASLPRSATGKILRRELKPK